MDKAWLFPSPVSTTTQMCKSSQALFDWFLIMVGRFQKASLYGWAGGSLCTVISESWELVQLNKIKRKDESEEAWQARQAKAISEINSHSLVLFHGLVQVCDSAPLLIEGKIPTSLRCRACL